MQKNVLQILWLALLLGFMSMVYFLSLLITAPFIVPVILAAIYGYFSYRWLRKNIVTEIAVGMSKPYFIWAYLVFITGIIIVTNNGYYVEQKYGAWDAWIMWNYHARFLQYPEYLKFFLSKKSFAVHADYPLYLPGNIAFFRRLTGTDNAVIPFIFSYFVTLVIPVTIYLALYRKNLVVASLAFLLIVLDSLYIDHGMSQYADLWVAFLFLCAFISLSHYSPQQKWVIAVTGALLGCCMWVKNEGIMLSLIFILFNVKTLFAKGRWKNFLAGIVFPLSVLVLFKSIAPATDLINGQSAKTSGFIFDASRYQLIWQHLADNFDHNFFSIKAGLALFLIFCFVERKWPGKDILILLACVLGFCFVYVMTPLPLGWHLATSMDRLLMQLMPSFIYVMASRFSRLRFSVGGQDLQ